ncbi:hypothetical protein SAMN06298216_3497 [Spirosomataceae bacterium TFI 002]|nr:hypothetical protein SAMN06298216_3497 [Spirosomataceae bacterium TFI 002]
MKKDIQISLAPEIALDNEQLEAYLKNKFNADQLFFRKTKQSIDARGGQIKVNQQILVDTNTEIPLELGFKKSYQNVSQSKAAIVVGSGPAGLFAALRLIELGIKPIVIERGKDVRTRRRDLAAINKIHVVNGESNYCYGEGGAGTYSDGKLYTRSKKRGDILRILEIFVSHGATSDILVDNHPHIGTNKLPAVVSNLRESIIEAGGEVHFNTKVTDLILVQNEIKGVIDQNGKNYEGIGVILATGHSARDIFELLENKKVFIEAKPFAMGVRIEHQQSFVDQCQYKRKDRGLLPAASYSLVAQTKYKGIQRGVFSFCMCPGGFIVPSATAEGEIVVNGMSPSRRDSKFANSGVVVAINEPDWQEFKDFGPLAALQFQKQVEQKAYEQTKAYSKFGKHSQLAPAQLIPDFIQGRVSTNLNDTSYQPGLVSSDMKSLLPANIAFPLNDGLKEFGKKMRGYSNSSGQLIGIESRTSSPVRIPRDKETLEHVSTRRLFPCGEGAGYAGGIVSAAIDGEKCAEAMVRKYGL